MEAYELLREVFQPHNIRELAEQEKLSPSSIYKWTEAGEQHRLNPLEHTARIYRYTRDRRILDWIAEQVGGRFILPAPHQKPSSPPPSPAACPTRRQLEGLRAAVTAELAAAWRSPKPAAQWRRSWKELLAEAERRMTQCGRACEARKPCRVGERAFAFAAFLKASAGE